MPRLPGDQDDDAPADPTERAIEGWEPTLASPGPSGHAEFPKRTNLAVFVGPPAPRLCDHGPCKRLHTMEILMDSQQPIDGSPGTVHREIVRTCFMVSDSGNLLAEMPLSGTTILKCSSYAPRSLSDDYRIEHKIPAVSEFEPALATWIEARAKLDAEIAALAAEAVGVEDPDAPSFTDDSPACFGCANGDPLDASTHVHHLG